jgi:hypothetical protein
LENDHENNENNENSDSGEFLCGSEKQLALVSLDDWRDQCIHSLQSPFSQAFLIAFSFPSSASAACSLGVGLGVLFNVFLFAFFGADEIPPSP